MCNINKKEENIKCIEKLIISIQKEEGGKLQEAFDQSIKSNRDLSIFIPKFMLYLLRHKEYGVFQEDAIKTVIDLYQEWVDTDVEPDKKRFKKAAVSARRMAVSSYHSGDYLMAQHARLAANSSSSSYIGDYTEFFKLTIRVFSEKLIEFLEETI